jgi:L-aminopeptidase/D-esterase-like protein
MPFALPMTQAPRTPIALPGLHIGHATHAHRPTGCTVWLWPQGTVGSVEVRGAAPGTRETDVLHPDNTVSEVHGLCLSGGSAFGLDAASGVMHWLAEQGRGVAVGPARVPIVPSAVIFDLTVGDAQHLPDAALGRAACASATPHGVPSGNWGAGAGATVGKLRGPDQAMRGGFGQCELRMGELRMLAWAVVNAVGDVWHPLTHQCLAGARTAPDSLTLVDMWQALAGDHSPHHAWLGGNTTLGVVATNQRLNKQQAHRLAMAAHNGLAQSIKPVHTAFDGDAVFAFSTGSLHTEPDVVRLGAMAAQALSLAVVDAVMSAQSLRLGTRWWPSATERGLT